MTPYTKSSNFRSFLVNFFCLTLRQETLHLNVEGIRLHIITLIKKLLHVFRCWLWCLCHILMITLSYCWLFWFYDAIVRCVLKSSKKIIFFKKVKISKFLIIIMFWYELFNCLDIKIVEKPSKSKNIRVKKDVNFQTIL